MMNKQQAEAIFSENAMLVNGRDVIPEKRCEELTGVKRSDWHFVSGTHYSIFGIGAYQLHYYTLRGFLEAVCVMNVREYTKKACQRANAEQAMT